MALIKQGDKLKNDKGQIVEIVEVFVNVKVRDEHGQVFEWPLNYVVKRCTLIDPPGDGLTRKLIERIKQLEHKVSTLRGSQCQGDV